MRWILFTILFLPLFMMRWVRRALPRVRNRRVRMVRSKYAFSILPGTVTRSALTLLLLSMLVSSMWAPPANAQIWTSSESLDFTGGATTRGAAFGPWTQTEFSNHADMSRDGSGNLVFTSVTGTLAVSMSKANTAGYNNAVELTVGPWNDAWPASTGFDLYGRRVSPIQYTTGGTQQGYFARIQQGGVPPSARVEILQGNNLLITAFFTSVTGHYYRLRMETTPGAAGHTHLRATVRDEAALGSIIGDTGIIDDATAALNDTNGTYVYGPGGSGEFYEAVDLAAQHFYAYSFMAQSPAATISSATLSASGQTVSAVLSSLGAPMVTTGGAAPTGFSVRARPYSAAAWQTLTIAKSSLTSNVVSLLLSAPVPANWTVQVIYSGGNVTDSQSLPVVPMAADAGHSVTNSSTYMPPHGVMVLGTRGNATTLQSSFTNLEGQSRFRIEMPYGAAPGWKIAFQGFTDGAVTDSIIIKKVGWWLAPDTASNSIPIGNVTFAGGSAGATIAHDTVMETDGIAQAVRPGSIIWVTTWYKTGNPATGLPYQLWSYVKEFVAGSEDHDGALQASIGTMTDHTLTGGFNHGNGMPPDLFGGLSFLANIYHPLGVVGKPSAEWVGQEQVPLFIGDSISAGYNDFSEDNTDMAVRGYPGRFCGFTRPYVNWSLAGSGSTNFTGKTGTATWKYLMGDLGAQKAKVTIIYDEYGINQVRTRNPPTDIASYLWADRAATGTLIASYGLPWVQSTLTPCEQSWTSWTPTDSGGINDTTYAIFVAQRAEFNGMVRSSSTTLPGCIGYWDPNSAVENGLDSNIWTVGARSDGIHPSPAGHVSAASTISGSLLTNNPNPVYAPAVSSGRGRFIH